MDEAKLVEIFKPVERMTPVNDNDAVRGTGKCDGILFFGEVKYPKAGPDVKSVFAVWPVTTVALVQVSGQTIPPIPTPPVQPVSFPPNSYGAALGHAELYRKARRDAQRGY